MKYIILLITVLSILSCNNIGAGNKKMVCSQQSDLFYLGYKGKIKKITTKSGYAIKNGEAWMLEDIHVIEKTQFDRNGHFIEKRTINVSGVINDTTLQKYARFGNKVVRMDYELNTDGQKTVYGLDTTEWVSENMKISTGYYIPDVEAFLSSKFTVRFDTACLVSTSSFLEYDWRDSQKPPKYDSFDAKKLGKDVIDLRKKHGHQHIYYSKDVKLIATDKLGNPTKIIYTSGKPFIEIKTYEYYH